MLLWEKNCLEKAEVLPGPPVAVLAGIILNEVFKIAAPQFAVGQEHLVNLPVRDSIEGFAAQFVRPDLSGFLNPQIWAVGITIAIVALIETLLSLEAVDRIDPLKRYSPGKRKSQRTISFCNGFKLF